MRGAWLVAVGVEVSCRRAQRAPAPRPPSRRRSTIPSRRCFFSLTRLHFSHMSEPILPISHLEIRFFQLTLDAINETLEDFADEHGEGGEVDVECAADVLSLALGDAKFVLNKQERSLFSISPHSSHMSQPHLPSISQAFIFEVFDSSHSPHSSHMSQPHSSLYVNNIFPTSPTHLTLTDSCRDRRPTSSSGSHLHSAARCATTMTRGRRRGSTTATPTTSSPRSPKTYTRRVDTPSALIASHGSSGKRRHVPNSVYTTQTESNRYR